MKHYNPSISKKVVNELNLKGENTDEIADEIILNIPVKKIPFVYSVSRTTTTALSATGTNLQTDRRFWMTGVLVSIIKDAACDSATGTYELSAYSEETGTQTIIGQFSIIALTAQQINQFIPLDNPMLLMNRAGSTAVSLSGTFTAGVCVRAISIFGYHDNNI